MIFFYIVLIVGFSQHETQGSVGGSMSENDSEYSEVHTLHEVDQLDEHLFNIPCVVQAEYSDSLDSGFFSDIPSIFQEFINSSDLILAQYLEGIFRESARAGDFSFLDHFGQQSISGSLAHLPALEIHRFSDSKASPTSLSLFQMISNFVESRILNCDRPQLESVRERVKLSIEAQYRDDSIKRNAAHQIFNYLWNNNSIKQLEHMNSSLMFIDNFYSDQFDVWFSGFMDESLFAYSDDDHSSCLQGIEQRVMTGLRGIPDPGLMALFLQAEAETWMIKLLQTFDSDEKIIQQLYKLGFRCTPLLRQDRMAQVLYKYLCMKGQSLNVDWSSNILNSMRIFYDHISTMSHDKLRENLASCAISCFFRKIHRSYTEK